MMKHYVRLACFVGGALFGSAGVKLLTSKDAKNAYIHITAAGLRMKDSVMETVTAVQENAADIVASAKDINEARASKEAKPRWRVRRLKSCGREPESGSLFHRKEYLYASNHRTREPGAATSAPPAEKPDLASGRPAGDLAEGPALGPGSRCP